MMSAVASAFSAYPFGAVFWDVSLWWPKCLDWCFLLWLLAGWTNRKSEGGFPVRSTSQSPLQGDTKGDLKILSVHCYVNSLFHLIRLGCKFQSRFYLERCYLKIDKKKKVTSMKTSEPTFFFFCTRNCTYTSHKMAAVPTDREQQ